MLVAEWLRLRLVEELDWEYERVLVRERDEPDEDVESVLTRLTTIISKITLLPWRVNTHDRSSDALARLPAHP